MFHRIIFLLLIVHVSSLSCNFNRCAVCFQSFMNIAYRSTQIRTYQTLLRLHIVIKPINKKVNIINSLLCWRVILLMFIQTLDHRSQIWRLSKVRTGRPYWTSWILTEWNLSWKIVKYCILSEVCMINTAPHSTVSPHMWCIKSIKDWFCTPPNLLARFCKVNLSNAKKSAWFVFQA